MRFVAVNERFILRKHEAQVIVLIFSGLNLIYAGRVTMINLQYSETNDALRLESSGGSSLCHQHCGIFVVKTTSGKD